MHLWPIGSTPSQRHNDIRVRISDRFLRNRNLMNLGFISPVSGIQYFRVDKFNCVEFRSRGDLLRQHLCDAEM
jgi:hypothetical protein